MPVTIGQITGNIAKATFTVTIREEDEEGQEHTYQENVNIKFYPGRITEKTIALSRNAKAQDDVEVVLDGFKAFNEELVRLIKWWDVLENDRTTMFPLDPTRLEELSFDFRGQLLNAMVDESRPEEIASQVTASNGLH